ncbi:MAG: dihydroneopterin triphosphate diphosphatase [Acidiferrobacterales bacterium]
MNGYKRPESVLVVVHTATGKVLVMRRRDKPEFWQSVTGSMRWDEDAPVITARRELKEETGLTISGGLRDWDKTYRFKIMSQWAHRYAPGTCENVEHLFSLELPGEATVTLNPNEHVEFAWLSFDEALTRVTSWTNREAIELVQKAGGF